MNIKNPAIFFLAIVSLISSCKKDEVSEFTDSPIIEAYLNPGDYFNVKISRQIPFSSNISYSSDDINNLIIKVIVNNNTHMLQPLGNGKYIDSTLTVSENDNYNLTFQFNSKTVTAYTFVPAKPSDVTQSVTEIKIAKIDTTSGPPSGGFSMPDPIKITWKNSDNSYYLIVVENMEATLVPIRELRGGNAPPSNFFRKQPTSASSEEIRSMEFQYYGKHRIIIYHVLPDYASLYDQSSTSSQNLANPSTSITYGYGIFTGLNADTLFLEVKEP